MKTGGGAAGVQSGTERVMLMTKSRSKQDPQPAEEKCS